MTLIVETGAGVPGAEAYASVAEVTTYWKNRPHDPLAATWSATATSSKEGAIREATAFIDATWGQYYLGVPLGTVQGLLQPRSGAKDAAGYDLPARPPQLLAACAELAGRAVSARLAEDKDRGGMITEISEALGPLKETTKYAAGAPVADAYGSVAGILAPILNGNQPGAAGDPWAFR